MCSINRFIDEKWATIKFCVKNGFSRIKFVKYISNVYGAAARKNAIYKPFKCFGEGRENLTDDEHSRRPVTLMSWYVAVIKELLDKNIDRSY